MRLILTSILLLPQLIEAQPATWTPRGIGSGGAIQNPTISPFNGNRVYLSCDMSQMFETTDFGATWNIQNHSKIQGGIRGKVVYTNDPLKLYAISASSSGAYVPKKSLDGGNTWSNFSNNPCVNFGAFQIYSNPSDFNQFVISDKKNIYFTNNGGTSFVTIDTDNSTPGIHLAGVFFEGQNIYISSNKKMFKSTDGGLSFPAGNALTYSNANILSTEGVVSFTGAKENGITKFFCSTISASNLTCRTYGSDVTFFVGLYELTAPFTSWSNITGSLSNSNASDVEKAYYVTMLPTDIDTLYIGGAVASGGSNYGTVFRSTNSGVNWTNQFLNNTKAINNTDIYTGWVGNSSTAGYTHGWVSINTVEGLAIDPNDVNRIIMTDKSAAHYSTDGGTIWHQMYVQPSDENPSNQTFSASKQYATSGLETTVTYWLTWIDQQNMIASCADITAIKSSNAGQKWSYDYSTTNIYAAAPLRINDVSMIIKHPSTGVLYASTGDVVGSNGIWDDSRLSQSHGRICFSTDNGTTWQILHDFDRPVTFIHIDKNNPDTMFACVQDVNGGTIGGIYRCNAISTGSSSVWDTLTSPSRANNRPNSIYALSDGSLMASYYPYDSTGSFNYAHKSGVFYSIDGGSTWIDRSDILMQEKTFTLIPDPNDVSDSTWYACVGNTATPNAGGIYKTVNRGSSWINLLPGTSVVSCTFHPILPNEMYICSELTGLYYATNTNNPTFSPNPISNYDFRAPQRVFFNPYDANEVWVTSFGNGLKKGQTSYTFNNISTSSSPSLAGTTTGSGTYASGTSATVNATANSGYTFVDWTENGTQVSTNASYSFTVSSDRTLVANFNNITGLTDLLNVPNIVIYPNPANDIIHFSEKLANIEIHNILGELLLKQIESTDKIIISHLTNGIYFLTSDKLNIKFVKGGAIE